MKWILFIFMSCFILANSNVNYFPIAEVIEIDGEVSILPAKINKSQMNIIAGRSIYNGDILRSTLNSNVKIQFIESDIVVSFSGQSEMRLVCIDENCHIKLNYGSLFIEDSNTSNNLFSILTKSSEVFIDNNEVWIARSIIGKDEIYSINGTIQISTFEGTNQFIHLGEKILLMPPNKIITGKITKNMLPDYIYERLKKNMLFVNNDVPFSVMKYFTDEPLIIKNIEEKIRPFNFAIEVGSTTIERSQYGAISLLPKFIGNNITIGYNFNGFIGLSDSTEALNSFSNLSQTLGNLNLVYNSTKNSFQFKVGQLRDITFGYGMLIKRYTNTISYPLKQDGGININYKPDTENYKLNLFFSSIQELSNGGGIVGVYANKIIRLKKPIIIGAGLVLDLNQFGGLSDTIWSTITPRKRSINGVQFDISYELSSSLLNDTYLFSEFSTINYADNLRYIRSEEVNWDTTTAEQGYTRKNSFGILGPGIHWKIGHHRDIKIALSYLSSLYVTPFFGETYHLERVHYVNSSIIDSIDSNEPYSKDEEWNTMIKQNYIDLDSSAYYLPKDINALLDPTKNVYNKIGFAFDYQYKFRNYYKYSIDFSMHKETDNLDSSMTYYTIGINFDINDGLVHGISDCSIYFNQYYTSEPFETTIYNENTVFGAQLGIKIIPNLSLYLHKHDVFYDNNLDGEIDLNSTIGFSLKAKF